MSNDDLKYDKEENPGPITPYRAFTISELAIYRFRDTHYEKGDAMYDILTRAAQEISEIRQSWKGKD